MERPGRTPLPSPEDYRAAGHHPRSRDPLSRLIEAALDGEEIVIAKGSKPVVRLIPIPQRTFRVGPLEGQLGAALDFLKPMEVTELDLWQGGHP